VPLRTFEGPSVGELLAQIRAELGSEAVILDVRQRPHGVALTAADPATADTYKAGPSAPASSRSEAGATDTAPMRRTTAAATAGATPASPVASPVGSPLRSPVASPPPARPAPLIVPPKTSASTSAPTRSRFNWWGLRSRSRRTRQARPLVLAFVGPTGAGKTTTIAKLAAHPRLFGGAQVGILNLDTYRVGATEQIAQYAALSNVPVTAARRLKDLGRARRALRSCQVVLVDCPGRGPNLYRDTATVTEMLDALDPIERHLVMPVGTQPALVRRTIDHFRPLGITHLLATKVDEMPDDWILFDVAADLGLPMRWLTDGQTIPQDLRSATARLEAAAAGRQGRHRVVSAGVA
jgi:flagellar biosynthesis protein FlhF